MKTFKVNRINIVYMYRCVTMRTEYEPGKIVNTVYSKTDGHAKKKKQTIYEIMKIKTKTYLQKWREREKMAIL